MWSYQRNQRSKHTNLVYLQFLLNYALFPKTGPESCQKKNLEYESILYNSKELSVDWTSDLFSFDCSKFSISFFEKNKILE